MGTVRQTFLPLWASQRPWADVPARRLLIVAGVVALALAAATLGAVGFAPPGLAVSTASGATDVPLESAIRVAPSGWLARLESATLTEMVLDPEGAAGPTREVPLRIDVVREGAAPGQTEVAVRSADGPLRPDGEYRLLLRGSALEGAFPWPRLTVVERDIRFTTLSSPRPLPQGEPRHLTWEEPLEIHWSAPIEDFRSKITPSASTRSRIDPDDPRAAYVVIEDPQEGITYEVTVEDARGTNGVSLRRPATYQAVTPIRPRPVGVEKTLSLEIGAPVQIAWNVPIERLEYRVNPPLKSTWRPIADDPSVTELRLEGPAQGTRYEVTVTEARSDTGAPLVEPLTITLATPPKLMVDDLRIGTVGSRVPVAARPTIVFAEPIRDRAVAEASIAIDPAVPGRFEWIDARQVRFVPQKSLPYDSEVTIRIRPGLDGPRSVDGAYFERPPVLSFRTELDKIIDVNVTRQVMTLIQAGRVVQTLPVATGVPGADTPIGEFVVSYKMPQARFRGTNPNGSRYDIGDVKWVLSFQGDYTIHGAYWRSAFGRPGSNGCVSLTDANAKLVYDWAPEGTLVRIHH